ncbi:hypothetical protein JCGZ_26514 [Jatropha curcas]|uniref:Uncharacterized protein n=1 Tax=Jatropha curcas TaxID=180498 RepID=A0A067JL86_JATCU|nr:hypothetical protein JCGZ_26514 [Jatropha curcas]
MCLEYYAYVDGYLEVLVLVMSEHLPDEEVDSYSPPEGVMLEGGMLAGGVAGGILGSDAEHASAVGQATAGPAGLISVIWYSSW